MCPPQDLLSAHRGQFWQFTAVEFVPMPATVVTELYLGMAKPTPLAWMCGIGSTQRANRKEEGDLKLEFPPEINEMK